MASDVITVNPGDFIPCDGEAIEGFALVDESAIAGVSTPAMIEPGTERSAVCKGGRVVEGSLKIRCAPKRAR